MNKLKNFFKPTRIAKKLIRRIALVALISLVVSFGTAYAVFWPRLQNEAHDSAAAAGSYLILSINEAVTNLSGYADYIASSEELSAVLEACIADPTAEGRQNVCRVLTSLGGVSSHIRTVALEGAGGYFQAEGLLGEEDRSLISSTWYVDLLNGVQVHTWSSFYVSNADRPVNTIARVVPCTIGGNSYVLSIFYNADSLISTIDALAGSAYTGYMLTDRHDGRPGIPFYETGELGNAASIVQTYYDDVPYSTRDAKGHYFLATIPENEWVFLGYIDTATFNSSLTPFIWLLLMICLVFMVLILLLLVPAVNRLLAPLGELGATMRRVSREGSDFYSPVQTDDEIGELSDVFNDMLDEVRINAETKLEQEKKEQHLSYRLMVSQINSHFFYNTLSVINSLARQGRNDDVIRANSALTAIFQDCLRPQSVSVGDTVAQEMRIVECYWVIESLDPANDSSLQWDIPEELFDKRIPKNIIQPLVENALFHGLDDAGTGKKSGRIYVSLRQEGPKLVLRVSNNGTPIPPELLYTLNDPSLWKDPGLHIGLRNIRRRLRMIYGDSATLQFASDPETTVTIRMPDILSAPNAAD